jgi:hypothetical protein
MAILASILPAHQFGLRIQALQPGKPSHIESQRLIGITDFRYLEEPVYPGGDCMEKSQALESHATTWLRRHSGQVSI